MAKEYFEDEEQIIWNVYSQKQCLLIKTNNYEEYEDIYNEAKSYLIRLQKINNLQNSYIQREELQKRIYEWKDRCHKANAKRLWLTYIGFFAAYQFILFSAAKVIGLDSTKLIEEIIIFAAMIIPSLLIAGIHFLINFSVFDYLFKKEQEEYNHWSYLKKEIDTIEDKIAGYPRPTDQEIDQIKQRYEIAKKKLAEFHTE